MNALMVPTPVTGPAQSRAGVVVGEPGDDDVDELVVGAAWCAVDDDRAVGAGRVRVQPQPGGDLVDDHRVLVALVLGVGEHVRQQLAGAELGQRPPERFTPLVRPVTCGRAGQVVRGGRGEEADRGERLRRQAEPGVGSAAGRRRAGCWRGRGTAGPRP